MYLKLFYISQIKRIYIIVLVSFIYKCWYLYIFCIYGISRFFRKDNRIYKITRTTFATCTFLISNHLRPFFYYKFTIIILKNTINYNIITNLYWFIIVIKTTTIKPTTFVYFHPVIKNISFITILYNLLYFCDYTSYI